MLTQLITMNKRQNTVSAQSSITASLETGLTVLPLPLTLTLSLTGTVFGKDGSETLWNNMGHPISTLAIPSGPVTISSGQIVTAGEGANQVTFTALATSATVSSTVTTGPPTTTDGSSTGNSGGTITTGPQSNTATGASSGIAVSATLLPGNQTLVWTDPNNSIHKIPAHPKGGIQPAGAAAGLAIGCLIAGALIAALVAFLLFYRRNKRKAAQNAQYEPATYTDEHHLKHPTTIATVPIGAVSAVSIVENNLPQPKEDNAIIGDLSRIKSRIEGHVDSYYHTAKTNNKAVAQALSDAVGTAFPISIAKLQELLSNPRKCPALLRAALAWIIISRIDFKSEPSETFLPAHLAGATRDLTSSRMDESTRVAFLSKWRQITAALSGNTFLQEIPADDARLANIKGALALADTFLRPYAKDADHDKRLFNLEEIMKRAARFGFLLFSQPSSFQFDWADSGSGLVVFPGLLQASDDNGKPLASPRPFGQKEVVPI